MWFKYGLKAQKLQKQHALNQRSPAEGKGKGRVGRYLSNYLLSIYISIR